MPVVEDFEHWFQELRWKLRGYQPGGLGEASNVEYTPSSGPGTSLTAYGSGNFNSSPVSVNDASPFWSVLNGDTISHTFTISMRVNNAVSGQFTLPPGAGVCLPSRVIAAVAIDTPTTAVTWFYSEANVNWSLPKPAPGGGVTTTLSFGNGGGVIAYVEWFQAPASGWAFMSVTPPAGTLVALIYGYGVSISALNSFIASTPITLAGTGSTGVPQYAQIPVTQGYYYGVVDSSTNYPIATGVVVS